MFTDQRKYYTALLGLSLCCDGWILLNLFHIPVLGSICWFKQWTHFPCMLCGSTRFAEAFLHGHFSSLLHYNPLGILLLIFSFLVPIGVGIDKVRRTNALFRYYLKLERWRKQPWIVVVLSLLLCLNWYWSICKGL